MNFYTLFAELNANLYFGGDNVIFWGPLAKTVIYGLIVATFLTLIVVPILFYLTSRLYKWVKLSNRALDSRLSDETELT